jgi:long-subunit acyl-CoA synthetase (AMP-forming)
MGLELLEGYSVMENFNYFNFNWPKKVVVGTVLGQPYNDDVEERIVSNGEIQVRGPGTMIDYYKNQEATNK